MGNKWVADATAIERLLRGMRRFGAEFRRVLGTVGSHLDSVTVDLAREVGQPLMDTEIEGLG